jgi:hypothetical protein
MPIAGCFAIFGCGDGADRSWAEPEKQGGAWLLQQEQDTIFSDTRLQLGASEVE